MNSQQRIILDILYDGVMGPLFQFKTRNYSPYYFHKGTPLSLNLLRYPRGSLATLYLRHNISHEVLKLSRRKDIQTLTTNDYFTSPCQFHSHFEPKSITLERRTNGQIMISELLLNLLIVRKDRIKNLKILCYRDLVRHGERDIKKSLLLEIDVLPDFKACKGNDEILFCMDRLF